MDYRSHDGEMGNKVFDRIAAEEKIKRTRERLVSRLPFEAEAMLTEYESMLIEKAFNLGRLSER